MALFKFDEEMSNLTNNMSCAMIMDDMDDEHNDPLNYRKGSLVYGDGTYNDVPWHKNLMSNNPSAIPPYNEMIPPTSAVSNSNSHVLDTPAISLRTRRSSLYDKIPINTPPCTTRLSLAESEVASAGDALSHDGKRASYRSHHSPRKLEDFKPVRVLGKGAYGKVLLVKDRTTSKLYAMKQLRKAEILITKQDDSGVDAEGRVTSNSLEKRLERTFAERTILSELEHPNVVKLFYSFHDHHRLYLVLQYIPGGELFYHLKEQGTLEENTVAFYAAEISCALLFLHGKGVVYRDLKPENCLLNERGHLVLTDFGLSKKSVHQSDTPNDGEPVGELYSIIGTPEYCAPEILEGLPYTQNCDWYSLGCLAYDMLLGKPPFIGANHKVILNKISKEKGVKLPNYLSEGMKDYLSALLKKDTAKRWDVDRLWNTDDPKPRKKKAGQAKKTSYQSHFIFRKINWKLMESGELHKTTYGPIVPVITDWELAENFDSEFTEMRLDSDDTHANGISIEGNNTTHTINNKNDFFKGFSFVASTSYLDRYF
ncbi:HGL220Cp [Eremothecium sinecaudum]|uniref:HGL220Cp n=1 Tax=Eremothecium sinecaudum TaxID=45286 RepID=A0A0X8HV93_9SACH|nr:HGL220Cp [Eremothecium sinecaudum]AMD22120.1 HGL220Cp [Eremothecium sinecaudum]